MTFKASSPLKISTEHFIFDGFIMTLFFIFYSKTSALSCFSYSAKQFPFFLTVFNNNYKAIYTIKILKSNLFP